MLTANFTDKDSFREKLFQICAKCTVEAAVHTARNNRAFITNPGREQKWRIEAPAYRSP
mgnify:FL=1